MTVVVATTSLAGGGTGTRVAITGAALDFLDAMSLELDVSSGFLNEISIGVDLVVRVGVLENAANSSSLARDSLANGSLPK